MTAGVAGDGRARLRYTNVAIALHWAIAALILYNLSSGLLLAVLPRGFFALHISSGITILALTLVRIAWRLTHKPPPLLPMAEWERRLAHTNHFLLYLAMLLMPFSGWAMVSASPPAGSPGAALAAEQRAASGQPPRKGDGPLIWGLFTLPAIGPVAEVGRTAEGLPEQRALHERIETFHLLGGWLMLALFLLHVAGALKHQLIDRRRELARMGLGTPEMAQA